MPGCYGGAEAADRTKIGVARVPRTFDPNRREHPSRTVNSRRPARFPAAPVHEMNRGPRRTGGLAPRASPCAALLIGPRADLPIDPTCRSTRPADRPDPCRVPLEPVSAGKCLVMRP
ncbi:hypothetical protein GCM10025331_54590 [Actinoplanes utahensis]